jgi:hypothetical protein
MEVALVINSMAPIINFFPRRVLIVPDCWVFESGIEASQAFQLSIHVTQFRPLWRD